MHLFSIQATNANMSKDTFGELRALLQGCASDSLWDVVFDLLLDAYDQDAGYTTDALIPYAQSHLAAWDPSIERTPSQVGAQRLMLRPAHPLGALLTQIPTYLVSLETALEVCESRPHITLRLNREIDAQSEILEGLIERGLSSKVHTIEIPYQGGDALLDVLTQHPDDWPALRTLTLDEAHNLSPRPLESLLQSPLGLHHLNVRYTQLPFLHRLLTNTHGLPRLRALHLLQTDISPDTLEDLLETPRGQALEALSLVNHPRLEDEALKALARLLPPGLQTLELSGMAVGAHAITRFLEDAQMPALTRLELCEVPLNQGGVEALRASSYLPNLQHLDLWKTNLGPHAPLLLGGDFRTLEALLLSTNALDVLACEALANNTSLQRLNWLNIKTNPAIGDSGWGHLARASLPGLRYLKATNTGATSPSANAIATSDWWPALVSLTMNHADFHLEDIALLLQRAHALTSLSLEDVPLRPGDASVLAAHNHTRLSYLRLENNGLNTDDLVALIHAFPRLRRLTGGDFSLDRADIARWRRRGPSPW